MIWQIALIALLIVINAFFSAAEISVVSSNKIRLRRLAEDGNARAKAVLQLASDPGRFLATVQVGMTLAGFFASAVGAVSAAALLANQLQRMPVPIIASHADGIAVVLVTVAIAFLTIVLGELAPKNLAVRDSEATAMGVAGVVSWLERVAAPIIWVLNTTTNLLLGGTARIRLPSVTSEEIIAIADVAKEEGEIDERERQIVQGAFVLSQRRVSELVVPRVDLVALPAGATLAEAQALIVKTGHSRIPIYRGSIDDIQGVLHTKDVLATLLKYGSEAGGRRVAEIARPTLYLPETVRADEALLEMQHQRMHLAVVVDEYGGTAGVVTLENLLEELVGPIRDEYDAAEQPEIRLVSEGEIVVSGDADLGEVGQALDLSFGDQEVDTVGGLVYMALGRIPLVGDSVEVFGAAATAEVLRMAGNRVSLVRLTHRPADGSAGESAGSSPSE